MSETLKLASVQQTTGNTNGRAWTRFDLMDDQNNKIGSTFDAALGNAVQAHVGGMVDVERTHDGKGYKVTAIRPSNGQVQQTQVATQQAPPAPVQQAAPAQGNYYKPRDPAEQASIRRQVALKAAAAVCQGRDVGTADVLGLAQSFDNWLASSETDSVPF